MSNFPGSLDNDSSLLVAKDYTSTTLSAAQAIGDSVAVVANPASWAIGMVLSVDVGKTTVEQQLVTGVAGNVLSVTRAYGNTIAAAHASGATVSNNIDAVYQSAAKGAIIAIETALGANLSNVPASPQVSSKAFNFTALVSGAGVTVAGGALAIGNNALTFATVPAGVNGTDLNHYLYVSNGVGTAEAVLITGGTGVAGQANGQIIVQCANTHSGAWQIQSATAGIAEALASIGTAAGAVFVAPGKWNVFAPIRIQYSSQTLQGSELGSYLNKMTAAGNLIHVQAASGTISFNAVSGLLITTDGAVTPTAGAMIYIDTTAKVGLLRDITMQTVWVGVQCFGANWTGGDITVLNPQASGSSYGFNLRGGQWNNLQPIQNNSGGVGIFVDAPCDGLQISNSFPQGKLLYGILLQGSGSTPSTRVLDVSITNCIFDSFLTAGIGVLGGGTVSLVNISNCHFANQQADASNQAAIYFADTTASDWAITGCRFLYGLRRFIDGSSTTMNNLAITGNVFLNPSNGSSGTYSAIFLSNTTGLTITGNVFGFYDGGAATGKYDIELSGTITHATIIGNVLRGNVTGPISYAGTMAGCVVKDNEGLAPLFAAAQYTPVAGGTPLTLTGAQLAGAQDVTVNLTAALGGAGAVTVPTAANIVAAIQDAAVGQTYRLRIINSSSVAFAWTVTTNTGITLTGTMAIAQNTWRDFYVTLTSLTAVAIQSIGTGTFS